MLLAVNLPPRGARHIGAGKGKTRAEREFLLPLQCNAIGFCFAEQQLLFRAYRLLQLHLLEPRQALLVHTLLALQVLEMQLLLLPDLLANLLAQAAQHSLLLLDGIGGLGHLGLHLLNLLLCVDRTGQLQEHGNIGRDWIDHTSCRWALTGLEDGELGEVFA
ncbi:hypothetical protein KC323_g258 [Hortaea werneckii]|nr:hypothetical protein KC323_g258 [Hortaea werneckii]